MKDLKVLEGSGFKTLLPGEEALAKLLIVKNKGTTGRRVGIFTRYNKAAAGQRLNHADALHEVKTVAALPQGYTSGVEVNLSAKRNYYHFGTFYINERYAIPEDGMEWFAQGVEIVGGGLKIAPTAPDLTKLRTTLKTGDASVSQTTAETSKNTFCSFTLVFAGTPYHIGLDVAKHPAHVTADLNARLNRIHPQLRGYVSAKYDAVGLVPLEFYIAPPESLDVTIPLTTFATKNDLSPTHAELGASPASGTFHLNKALASALLIDNTNGIRNTTNTVASVDNTAVKKNVDQLIDEAFVVNLNTFTHEVATPTLYTSLVTIPANAFKTWDADERVNFALLKLRRQYEDGRVFRLLNVRYKNSDGSATPYADQHADLFLLRAPNDADGATTALPSIYLNDLASADADQLEGYRYPTADAIKFAEAGELNEESAMYVGLFSTPTLDNRNSIFFRNTVSATYLEIEYELVEADVIPTVKIDDLGTLDFHYINTEEHAFRPLAFSTTPVHKWNIEFITDGQTERYQGINHGAVEGSNDIHMATQGTVGEAVILAGIDYSKVKPPAVDEPLYFYTGEIGAETWLYQNLPYVNVVTTREVNAVKSKYKVVFPDTAMTGVLENIEEPLIAKQSDGSLVISGRFSNPTYAKNVFFHSLSTTWAFSLRGSTLNPTEALTFDPLTGEFSARFAVNDLVEPGPGAHVFRVTASANYPWLAGTTQYTQTMDILVLNAVEGIEDDVTFIGSNLFDKDVNGTESNAYHLVDLDSGETLATGANPFALRQDALARGLVDIDLIFGKLYEEENVISCEGAPSSVDLDIDGEWDLEIEGVVVGSGTMVELKPLALTQDVQIITECIATPTTLLRGYKTDLKAGDVVRLAYQMTRGDLDPVIGSLAYKIGNTLTEDDENLGINRYGFDPLEMVGGFLNEDTNRSFLANSLNAPYNSSEWIDSCINGEIVMSGSFSGQRFTDIDSGGAVPATLPVNIDGVDHSITINHHFKLEADTTPADIESLMEKFAVQLRALGLVVTLEEYDMFYPPAGEPWLSSFIVTYEVGQFSNVVIGGSLNVGSGSNARINTSDFQERCRTQKTGVNTPVEFELELSGRDKMNTPGLIIDPVNIKFDTCANLGVNLLPGEIDYFPTIGIVEAGAFVGPFEIHSCGASSDIGG